MVAVFILNKWEIGGNWGQFYLGKTTLSIT
jgi:hypothetical protein